jgi:mRNA-degrading endonuclease RelE of RelBE toxin-antitoxin system
VLDGLSGHVLAAAKDGIKLAVGQFGKSVAVTLSCLETVLPLIRAEVKDPQYQARVLYLAFRVLCEPYKVGEVLRQDSSTRYGFGGRCYKARTSKYRIYYTIDDHVVTFSEVSGRDNSYTKRATQGRHSFGPCAR